MWFCCTPACKIPVNLTGIFISFEIIELQWIASCMQKKHENKARCLFVKNAKLKG
jgi:hypothetical protein